ncbi:hypothetical protein [Asanoa iriomotensis]|uniref:Uncharacterized protein n=1 Tax=Asanoa iriomotensis TaxID=234613 RepID=A0ABQ4CCN9_9ACTN|nr:hypothetical protein [Asanoa iriomotensis]GIF60538.1 hypothetical protein Air01nite_66330 [Asanoa iriomotensis]
MPYALVCSGLLLVIAVEFFTYPLDRDLFLFALVLRVGVWLAAAWATLAGVLLSGGWRQAAIPAVIVVLGFTWIIRADLGLGYPYAYFNVHRADFADVAHFSDSISTNGEAWVPAGYGGLTPTWVTVFPAPDGGRTVVLWMSYASGIGYGYAFAPSARRGQVVISDTDFTAKAALGDGWWWVKNI